MTTLLRLDVKGLDQFGQSTLTLSELKRHMGSAKIVALLDAAFTDIVSDTPRLVIRHDGTYIALPERALPLQETLSATIVLIDAMTASATNPGEQSEAQLQLAEMEFDEIQLKCVQRAILNACTSEAMEFEARIGEKNMMFRLPHKTTISTPKKTGNPHPRADEIKIKRIRHYLDAISNNGMAAFISVRKCMPSIKAGDKIRVRISTNAKRFLRALDAKTSKRD